MVDLSFTFTGECWRWQAEGATAWHFITLPQDKSEEIKFFNEKLHAKTRGFGAVKVRATIGKTTWETSIFPDSKRGAYLLPVKAEVRKKEKVLTGNLVKVSLRIQL